MYIYTHWDAYDCNLAVDAAFQYILHYILTAWMPIFMSVMSQSSCTIKKLPSDSCILLQLSIIHILK